MTLTRRDVVELMDRHGVRPSRALGQHFVVDPNTVRRIARLARVGPGDRVVEIGAGLGALTLAVRETGAQVVAVELDRHLVPALREVVEPAGVRVVEGDARTLDWAEVLGAGGGRGAGGDEERGRGWAMVGNLPYNIATSLVLTLLDEVPAIERMLVMVQREVGERLAAGVGNAAYGAVSVKVAYRARASVVGRVPPTVFLPQPDVESALVALARRPPPCDLPDERRLSALVDAGFGHRRKMLRRSLAGVVGEEAFAAAGIRPEARAEELAVEDWCRLAWCTSSSERWPS